ncbi:hypothetical protein N0B44_17455 [Roseibacterium beibuensis]|uniref:DUF6880 family protein n=1 Tax=[Roseibacterium] beibuensis TaxID=1193142 RepID=UPI00217D83BC|nr:DUF6880 family protein [Roseibacterium beibuensis]MCS6624707.1 hypothetical protein [Roseibacterium beibuensis]
MAKRVSTAKKTVTASNLLALGPDRLAALLLEAAANDPNLKRRLRMELAAEIGAADLAFEIDKRLTTLATSPTRVSWRKRPALFSDLNAVRRVIVERLAPLDLALALDRLVAWFDLYPPLAARVSDAKGELPVLFDAATSDLAVVASEVDPDIAAAVLGEALATRLNPWASWVGRGAQHLSPELARRLLTDLTRGKPKPVGRLALVVRKLAERSGDLDAWIQSIPVDDHRKPDVAAEIARRLAEARRPLEARAALEAARTGVEPGGRWRRGKSDPPAATGPWLSAEIAVLEAEGRTDEADAARWGMFERTLSPEILRTLVAKLADFEDVVALDRAFELAARHPDAMRGLGFLMNWSALREAADLIVARPNELQGGHDEAPLWASRLAGRFPLAALLLTRATARALVSLGSGITEEVQGLIAEAEALANGLDDVPGGDHAAFVNELHTLASPRRRRW